MLERSDAYPAELIGRLDAWDDAAWLDELLMDLLDDVGEIARTRLVDELRRTVERRSRQALLPSGRGR